MDSGECLQEILGAGLLISAVLTIAAIITGLVMPLPKRSGVTSNKRWYFAGGIVFLSTILGYALNIVLEPIGCREQNMPSLSGYIYYLPKELLFLFGGIVISLVIKFVVLTVVDTLKGTSNK